jgi:hypothetical protein
MASWRVMAGGVRQAVVAEIGRLPGVGLWQVNTGLRSASGRVATWQSVWPVWQRKLASATGDVTGRTLAGEVTPRRRVAGGAVRLPAVIEVRWLPGIRAVTVGTLPAKVVRRAIPVVTGLAVGRPGGLVVETGRLPCIGRVAARTLAVKMVRRTGMAVLAIVRTSQGMIEVDLAPGRWGVTGGTIAVEMVCRAILGVAGAASSRRPGIPPDEWQPSQPSVACFPSGAKGVQGRAAGGS